MKIIDIKDKNSVQNAAKVLKNGGILVFPTDTVYGIGCALNIIAIKKLYKIKNRSLTQPTAILISSKIYHNLSSSLKSVIINKIMDKYPKGKVTLLVRADNFSIDFPKVLLKDHKIGFRIPNDKWLQNLLDKVGPIAASSANIVGESTPKSFTDINPKLYKKVDLIIKSDNASSSSPSSIYDIELDKIIR